MLLWPPKMRGVRVHELTRDLVGPSADCGMYPVTVMARCRNLAAPMATLTVPTSQPATPHNPFVVKLQEKLDFRQPEKWK
ncbi:hypothetical protein MTO96_042927, partial [Rhipicephalus appendiculatus]